MLSDQPCGLLYHHFTSAWDLVLPHGPAGYRILKPNSISAKAQLGTILLALPLGQLITMPISGRLVTKYGSRTILSFAVLLYAVELTNIGWAAQMWQLALALFIFGVVGNMSNISVNTQGVLAEKIYGRPIMTSFHGVWSIAGFTGALVGLLMMNLNYTPPAFFYCGGIGFYYCLYCKKIFDSRHSATAERKKFFSKPEGVLVQFGIIAFCSMAAEGTMFDWSGVYFKEVVKAPRSLVIIGLCIIYDHDGNGPFFRRQDHCRIGRKKNCRLVVF